MKQRKHYTPEEKVAILRRHSLDKEPISKLCWGFFRRRSVIFCEGDQQFCDSDQSRSAATLVLRIVSQVIGIVKEKGKRLDS
jgi:hypothetical protein